MTNKGTHTLEVKLVSTKGHCNANHKLGDTYLIRGDTEKLDLGNGGICLHALAAMLPKLFAMRYGSQFWWSADPDVVRANCPDAENPHVFEIRRVPGAARP